MSADAVVTQGNTAYKRHWKKSTPFLDIPLDPATPQALKGTFQETRYIQQLQTGKPMYHRLQANETTGKWEIINPDNQVVPYHKTAHVYSFVVLEDEKGSLVLRLGLGNHYFTSGRATAVKAAGDIHFWKGEITKITNQSGGYHFSAMNNISTQCTESTLGAMQAVGLPVEKFVAYVQPDIIKPALLFSNSLQRTSRALATQLEGDTSHFPHTNQKPGF